MKRRESRQKVLQCLYQMELARISSDEALENLALEERDDYLLSTVKGIEEHQEKLDGKISAYLQGWTLDRLTYVDRAILRLGTYEILFREDVPDLVAINEAVELAKTFSDEKAGKFINGVLSNIMKEKTGVK